MVQRPALVLDHHAAPIRLAGDRAVGLQQVTVQGFFHLPLRVAVQQPWLWLFVVADGNVQRIDALPRQRNHALGLDLAQGAHLHADRLAGGGGQVFLQARLQFAKRGEHRLVQ
ncbi:hypothetical protein D3C81_932500 [compost metagenome]